METIRKLESAIHLHVALGRYQLRPTAVREYTGRESQFVAGWSPDKPELLREPGFRCLLVEFAFTLVLPEAKIQAPMSVVTAYRQPLVVSVKDSRFFYVPFFLNQPKNASTTDTNRHSITITVSPDCSVTIANGEQTLAVSAGQSRELSPVHCQPIKAIVKPALKDTAATGTRARIASNNTRSD